MRGQQSFAQSLSYAAAFRAERPVGSRRQYDGRAEKTGQGAQLPENRDVFKNSDYPDERQIS